MKSAAYRQLPAMDQLLDEPRLRGVIGVYGRASVRVQATELLEALRREIAEEAVAGTDFERRLHRLPESVADAVVRNEGPGLRRVINATGIFVHTNLGRVPLPGDAMAALAPFLTGYCDLEMDLNSGRRSDRNRYVARLLRRLCGAESALVVNNNAGALVLVLAALARGREVVVSRGELLEIGGSFRIPEILEAAGARLVEVGTTNRTRLGDYRRALTAETALVLKVHTSNYRIRGFTETVTPAQLAALGRGAGVPVMVDEGSGLLRPSPHPPLRDHDDFQSLLDAGCDLVCGSGDKLLGGPQAGLLLGRAELLERCRRHPLYRALRPDRFAFAALELMLRRHRSGAALPIERLWPDEDTHLRRLAAGAIALRTEIPDVAIVEAEAFVGGGSAPDEPVLGRALAIEGSDELLTALRCGGSIGSLGVGCGGRDGEAPAPVVGYLKDGRLILDLRTVASADDEELWRAVIAARRRLMS